MSEWNGDERRKEKMEDHDILIEIKNDVKHLVTTFMKHTQDDAMSFEKHGKDIAWLQKMIWGALGAGALIGVMLKFVQ